MRTVLQAQRRARRRSVLTTMSSTQDLQWLLVRKSNSFLVKQKGLGRVFSREPGNVASLHSYKHSGVVNDKAVGVTPAPSGRGVVLTTKKTKTAPNSVRSSRTCTTIQGGSRRVARAVANAVAKNGYRADLRKGKSCGMAMGCAPLPVASR